MELADINLLEISYLEVLGEEGIKEELLISKIKDRLESEDPPRRCKVHDVFTNLLLKIKKPY